MSHINYSVIIRTIGKAGEKYQALLDAIRSLEPQPKEVIVVLPEGFELPPERLGWETFYFCPKGMVSQRMTGIMKCQTPYALVCDDDVSFDADFVQKLHAPVVAGLCGLSAGPLYSFLPEKGIKAVLSTLSGASAPTVFHKDRYVSVMRTAGYSYNRHLAETGYYESQSLAGTCFYGSIEAIKHIDFPAETWIDECGYSAYEDQTMFYKAWLRGIKSIVVADAYYVHNDGKTSTQNNKPIVTYCLARNRYIFWQRFIHDVEENSLLRLLDRIAFAYRRMWNRLWATADYLRGRCSKEDLALVKKAHKDARQYVKSDAYRNLPPVTKE